MKHKISLLIVFFVSFLILFTSTALAGELQIQSPPLTSGLNRSEAVQVTPQPINKVNGQHLQIKTEKETPKEKKPQIEVMSCPKTCGKTGYYQANGQCIPCTE